MRMWMQIILILIYFCYTNGVSIRLQNVCVESKEVIYKMSAWGPDLVKIVFIRYSFFEIMIRLFILK